MTVSMGYLTPKQLMIWERQRNGLAEASIARELNVTRQTVHEALGIAQKKVLESLEETAAMNKIKVQKVNPRRGYLVGYSPHFKTKALITLSAHKGIQVWYRDEGDCQTCEHLQTCREALIEEAKERNLPLSQDINTMMPSKFADELFARITGEKK
jgi:hypothetical protein